jgi:secreted Zn-dependent insulinase-like peptidase
MNNPNVVTSKKILDLPPPNNLIPKNLDVLPPNPELSQRPILVYKWNDTELWYKKDDKF